MEADNALIQDNERTLLGRKSWVAYLLSTFRHLLAFLVVSIVGQYSSTAGTVGLLLVVGHYIYRVFDLRSCELYRTDDGIWLFSGVLPWTKGVIGVKWRDLDEATFMNTIVSWATKSYTVRVGHRFTKSQEILLTHVACGDEIVTQLNEIHREMLRKDQSLNAGGA